MRLNGLKKAKVIIDRMILESSEFAERDVVVLHGVQWNDTAGDELYLGDGTPLEIREWTGRTRMHNGFRLDEAVFSIGFDRWRGFLPAPDFRSKHGMSPSEVMCDSPLVLHRIVDSVETGGVVLREGYVKGLRKAQHLLREQLESMAGGGFISEDEMTAIVKNGTKEAGLYEVMQYEDRMLDELSVDFESSPIVFLGDERQEIFRTTKLLDAIIYAKGMMEYTDDFKIQEIEF